MRGMREIAIGAMALLALMAAPVAALAQTAMPEKPGRAVEINWGVTTFLVEEQKFEHTLIGGGFRVPIHPRLAIGAEVAHLRGPGEDRDWVFAGKLTFDLVQDRADVPLRVVPYLVGAGGFLRHSDVVNDDPLRINTGFGNGGIGVRLAVGRHLYLSPEFRFGAETHWHLGLVIGIRDKRRPQ
jgi:hypothetical protein